MKPEGFFRAGIVFFSLFFALFLSAAVSASPLTITAGQPFSEMSATAAEELKIFDLVNRERARKGLSDLEWSDDLARLARLYSEKMARGNFFSHYEPDGASVVDRARDLRIKGWNKIGENLFLCFGMREYDRFAVQNWMKSDSHRRNILDPEYTASGIGLARSREGKIYVTQVFIRD